MSVKESNIEQSDVVDAEIDSADPEQTDESEVTAARTDEAEVADEAAKAKKKGEGSRSRAGQRLRFSISVRGLVIALVAATLVVAVGVLGWLYLGERHKVDVQIREHDRNVRAEQVALDYAVNAAAMNYQDLNAWKVKLVAGTTPELKDKLTKAADAMQQLLIPLQWTSTARPLVAKVRSDGGGTYVVDCFVSVMTKTVQASDPLQSTATYSVTINSNDNWQISDVGGIGAVTGAK